MTQTATQIVTQAVQARGFTHISPESLEDLKSEASSWGWHSVAQRADLTGPALSAAYHELMAGLRALLAPI